LWKNKFIKAVRHITENNFIFIDYKKFNVMNKKISGIVIFIIAAIAAWHVNLNLNSQYKKLSGISLANVEALAQESEEGTGNTGCNAKTSNKRYRGRCSSGNYYTTYDYMEYTFSCTGNGGSCSGLVGSSGNDCSNSWNNVTLTTKNC
jgi:hypothetical protein